MASPKQTGITCYAAVSDMEVACQLKELCVAAGVSLESFPQPDLLLERFGNREADFVILDNVPPRDRGIGPEPGRGLSRLRPPPDRRRPVTGPNPKNRDQDGRFPADNLFVRRKGPPSPPEKKQCQDCSGNWPL